MKYTDEQINSMLVLLNGLEIKGIDNAKRIVMIHNIIQQGEKDNDNSKE